MMMSDLINEFWHISAEEDGVDNIAVALTTYFESLPDHLEDAPINDEHGWTYIAMEKFENLDKRVTEHFQQQAEELQKVKQERDELKNQLSKYREVVEAVDTTEIRTALNIYKTGMRTGMIRSESAERQKDYEQAIDKVKEALSQLGE